MKTMLEMKRMSWSNSSNKQRWIYQQATEMARVLGMAVPEVELANNRLEAKQMVDEKRYTGWTGCAILKKHKIILAVRGKTLHSIRRIIAHELIHLAFPKLQHGISFEEYTSALLKGHMAFDRRGLITEVVKPKPPIDDRVTELLVKRKKLETRVKRLTTSIKKLDRKIKHLEKRRDIQSL